MSIDEMLEKVSNGEDSPAYELLDLIEKNDYKQAIQVIKKYLKCDENTAKIVCMDFKTKVFDDIYSEPSDLSPAEIAQANQEAQDWLSKPKCPICGSMNLTKISTAKKVVKIAAFGIFGMGDNGKTWKCNNCGSKF